MKGFKITDHTGGWFMRNEKDWVQSHTVSQELHRAILAQYFLPSFDHVISYIKSVARENDWELEFIDVKFEKPYVRFFRKLFRTT